MSEPFLAEIKIFGFNFAPRGWAMCDGQILPINQYQSLYSLLGTTYGGDGRTTFGLPDLRGRVPLHEGSGYNLGMRSGVENVALNAAQIPSHTHQLNATANAATTNSPAGTVFATSPDDRYAPAADLVNTASGAVANNTGGQAHDNMQPSLVLNFCIALQGLFPSRN
jgi:microcystin-dependent protein